EEKNVNSSDLGIALSDLTDVKVIATDGAQSTEQTINLKTQNQIQQSDFLNLLPSAALIVIVFLIIFFVRKQLIAKHK
ncbi:MAG: hypothetical protein Q7K42_06435, partial [Candidatus Diapherotrites archaeon]|nr:hypothetical protein [Candidatus Diapherotrites archaeon]